MNSMRPIFAKGPTFQDCGVKGFTDIPTWHFLELFVEVMVLFPFS
jgi:hypothetical protein